METEEELFHSLGFYTLSHPDPAFLHQEVVDAFGAQSADETTKPIRLIFSLVGLYLFLEKGYTGKEVQNFHVRMAENKKRWSKIELPAFRGNIRVSDVLASPPGKKRDEMIVSWCQGVWEAYKSSQDKISNLVLDYQPK